MNNDEKLIEKIEKLMRLSESNNEHEANAAIMKAQELMAKYHIDMKDVSTEEKEKEVATNEETKDFFRETWIHELATIIAHNFRCISIMMYRMVGNTYKIRFYGVNDDALICMQIFQYALQVVRGRCKTLKSVFKSAGKTFEYNDKLLYCNGFMSGLQKNFKEQLRNNKCYALAIVVPEIVEKEVNKLGATEHVAAPTRPVPNRKNQMLYGYGYIDGKNFQNAGDKERLPN
jgi:hypothetical protein